MTDNNSAPETPSAADVPPDDVAGFVREVRALDDEASLSALHYTFPRHRQQAPRLLPPRGPSRAHQGRLVGDPRHC